MGSGLKNFSRAWSQTLGISVASIYQNSGGAGYDIFVIRILRLLKRKCRRNKLDMQRKSTIIKRMLLKFLRPDPAAYCFPDMYWQ